MPGLFAQSFGAGDALPSHAALASSRIWRDVADGLAFDLPGHGRSADRVGAAYHGVCTAAALRFCDRPRDIVGHSFGATVALRLAPEHPHLCAACP